MASHGNSAQHMMLLSNLANKLKGGLALIDPDARLGATITTQGNEARFPVTDAEGRCYRVIVKAWRDDQ